MGQFLFFVSPGLSLRVGSRGFSLVTISVTPAYFHRKTVKKRKIQELASCSISFPLIATCKLSDSPVSPCKILSSTVAPPDLYFHWPK